MQAYHDLLQHVRVHGVRKKSRPVLQSTGQSPDTFAVFGYTLRHDLAEGFPLLTTKRMSLHIVVHELLWFLAGGTNVRYLQQNKVNIWNQWADAEGNVGPVYGKQWRRWARIDPAAPIRHPVSNEVVGYHAGPDIDQLANVVATLRKNPSDRRMIVTAWNPSDISRMGLPPCHLLFQFGVIEDRLNCMMVQRSADAFLGVPYNIASYALLTHMLAHVTGLAVGDLIINFGDLHIYENHLEQVEEQLSRTPYTLPRLALDPEVRELDDFRAEHVSLNGYAFHSALKAEVAV